MQPYVWVTNKIRKYGQLSSDLQLCGEYVADHTPDR